MDHARESIFFHWSNKTWYFHPIRYDSNRLYRLFVLLAPHIPSFIRIYFYSLPPPPPQRTTIIIQFDSIRIEFGNLNSIEFFLECITHTHTHTSAETKQNKKRVKRECLWMSLVIIMGKENGMNICTQMNWWTVLLHLCVCSISNFEFQFNSVRYKWNYRTENWSKKKSLSLRFFFCCCCCC